MFHNSCGIQYIQIILYVFGSREVENLYRETDCARQRQIVLDLNRTRHSWSDFVPSNVQARYYNSTIVYRK
jgi:hypothetical protein